MKLRSLALPLAMAGLVATAPAALAGPVESGPWTEDNPSYDTQTCAGGKVSGLNFSLPSTFAVSPQDACGNGAARAERRYKNYPSGSGTDYASGVRQFAGTFKITSMGGDRISLKQTFNGTKGPYFMLAVDKTGRLYSVEGGTTIKSGAAKVGSTVTVNTVHDTKAKKLRVYINGSLAYTSSSPSGTFYDKFGAYKTGSGHGPISVTWSDVHFWHH